MRNLVRGVLVLAAAGGALFAQNVISARSGLVQYTEGKVLLAGKPVEPSLTNFPEVKENQELRTEEGRAEVLLTPGVFLRLGELSSFRMVSSRLTDVRLEFLSGSAVIESDDLLKDNSVTITYKDSAAHLKRTGVYRFDSEPAEFRVYSGQATVEAGGKVFDLREGKILNLSDFTVAKFDPKVGDTLSRWSRRRGEYLAMANISAAKSLSDSGASWLRSGWLWNPYFGMFTFVPYRGAYWSPYGFRFWSPVQVYQVYAPRPVLNPNHGWGGGGGGYNSGLGYATMPQTSSGHSGTVASAPVSAPAPTTSAGAAASAPISRGGGQAGGGHR